MSEHVHDWKPTADYTQSGAMIHLERCACGLVARSAIYVNKGTCPLCQRDANCLGHVGYDSSRRVAFLPQVTQ